MCGRFALKIPVQTLMALFDFIPTTATVPRYNIAPSQPVLIVRQEMSKRKGLLVRWGLVPSWAKDPAIGNRMINTRSETIASKPAFRDAYRYRRCLIPADGFYEWRKQGKQKQPYFIYRVDKQPLGLAGLWEHWQDAHGNELETCTILTTSANETIKPLHERMPVIVETEGWQSWLNPDTPAELLEGLLRPGAEGILETHPVDSRMNRPDVDDAKCLEPLASPNMGDAGLFGIPVGPRAEASMVLARPGPRE